MLIGNQTRDRHAAQRWERLWLSDEGLALRLWFDDAFSFPRALRNDEANFVEADIRAVASLAVGATSGLWINGLWSPHLQELLELSIA